MEGEYHKHQIHDSDFDLEEFKGMHSLHLG